MEQIERNMGGDREDEPGVTRESRLPRVIHVLKEHFFGPEISEDLKALGGRYSRLGDRGFEPPFGNPGPVSPVMRAKMRQRAQAHRESNRKI